MPFMRYRTRAEAMKADRDAPKPESRIDREILAINASIDETIARLNAKYKNVAEMSERDIAIILIREILTDLKKRGLL